MSVEEQMPVHTLSNRSNSNDENENSFNPMYKATDDWIPGKEGFLDRFEHLETMASYWRRILASRSFWLKMILFFSTLQIGLNSVPFSLCWLQCMPSTLQWTLLLPKIGKISDLHTRSLISEIELKMQGFTEINPLNN